MPITNVAGAVRPAVVAALVLAATSCGGSNSAGHDTASAQALRNCVDRWNQGNMVGWGPAGVNIAFRQAVAKERSSIELPSGRLCIVAIPAGGGTWTCVLVSPGAYWCPPLHEPTGPPLTHTNATIDAHGRLELASPPKDTHPAPALAWQHYPHVDGFVLPWTRSGKLRPGLGFKGKGQGDCFHVDETARLAISCVGSSGIRYDACFPQRRNWRAGDLAACEGLGEIRFLRWTITRRF